MTHADRPFAAGEKTSCRIVDVRGEQDLATAPALVEALQRAATHPGSQIRVDLRAVTFMDCAGMWPLLQAREALGDRLCLWNPSPTVTRLLDLTSLLEAFTVIADPLTMAEHHASFAHPADREAAASSYPPVTAASSPSAAIYAGPSLEYGPAQGNRRRWWCRPCGAKAALVERFPVMTRTGSGDQGGSAGPSGAVA